MSQHLSTSTAQSLKRHTSLSTKPPNQILQDMKILENSLDLTYITDRILAMGQIWTNRTEKKSHRNNEHDLATFLNLKFGGKYLICHVSGKIKYS